MQTSNYLLGLSPVCFGAKVFQGEPPGHIFTLPIGTAQPDLSPTPFPGLNLSLPYSHKEIWETHCRFQPNSTAS